MRARLALGLAAVALFALRVPLHEYAHCLSWWARGARGVCEVGYTLFDGVALTGPIPWWEHPLIYGVTLGLPLALLLWALTRRDAV